MQNNFNGVDGLKETIKTLAERFNKVENGNKILEELDSKEKALKESASEKEEKKVIIWMK